MEVFHFYINDQTFIWPEHSGSDLQSISEVQDPSRIQAERWHGYWSPSLLVSTLATLPMVILHRISQLINKSVSSSFHLWLKYQI